MFVNLFVCHNHQILHIRRQRHVMFSTLTNNAEDEIDAVDPSNTLASVKKCSCVWTYKGLNITLSSYRADQVKDNPNKGFRP
jgi:hypothetical protein